MPGTSLWLMPPEGHPLNFRLSDVIAWTAEHFNSSHLFLPHVTITSGISPSIYSPDPQKWLDSIDFPRDIQVQLGGLASEDVFFRKLYSTVAKNDGLRDMGAVARKYVEGFADEGKAREWAEEEYMPHLSLLYHDCPTVSHEETEKVAEHVENSGISLSGKSEEGGWVGGRVVLMPTDRPIKDWIPIAEKKL